MKARRKLHKHLKGQEAQAPSFRGQDFLQRRRSVCQKIHRPQKGYRDSQIASRKSPVVRMARVTQISHIIGPILFFDLS